MSSNPTVSVLVMMYRPGGVDITMAAMRDQTFKDFELIVVDNRYEQRKDAMAALAAEYGVRLVHAPEHRRNGKWIVACAAFNTAIALARGKYVIILHDFTYVPPGWIEAHVEALEGHPRRYVMIEHVNVDLPEVKASRELEYNRSCDRPSTETDPVFTDGSLDEIAIFKDGRFDNSWLPRPIGPDQWQTNFTNIYRAGDRPIYGWVSLTNDSFHREFMYELNGIDERFDMGRGSFDANIGMRVAMAGGETFFREGPVATLMNPRFIMRTLPFGNHGERVPGRWNAEDCRAYYDRVVNEKRVRAANPYDLSQLAESLEPWRSPTTSKIPQEISDVAYWRHDLRPESPVPGQRPPEDVRTASPQAQPTPSVAVEHVPQEDASSLCKPMRLAVIIGKLSVYEKFDVDDLYGSGFLTGTGSNFLNIVRGLTERGHQVDAFCMATKHSVTNMQLAGASIYDIDQTRPDGSYDAYVALNEPDILRWAPADRLRICAMWLNDFGYCHPGFDEHVDVYACASETHARYMVTKADIDRRKFVSVPLSSNPELFSKILKRRPSSIAYCSSPDRGLHHLLAIFPEVRERVPDATLRIYYRVQPWLDNVLDESNTSGYAEVMRPRAIAMKNFFDTYGREGENGVHLLGPVPMKRMAEELLMTRVLAYPCDTLGFTEGFSVSVMDACMAGCVPIVAAVDALPEVYEGVAHLISGNPADRSTQEEWVEAIVTGLTDDSFATSTRSVVKSFAKDFTRRKVAAKWEHLIRTKLKDKKRA